MDNYREQESCSNEGTCSRAQMHPEYLVSMVRSVPAPFYGKITFYLSPKEFIEQRKEQEEHTLNLRSSMGGFAYGIPLNE